MPDSSLLRKFSAIMGTIESENFAHAQSINGSYLNPTFPYLLSPSVVIILGTSLLGSVAIFGLVCFSRTFRR